MTNIHTLETDTYKWETMYILVEEGQIFMKGGGQTFKKRLGWIFINDGADILLGGLKFMRGGTEMHERVEQT